MHELLKSRRSIRKYRETQIPDDLLDAILEAGLYAHNLSSHRHKSRVVYNPKDVPHYCGTSYCL